MSFFHYEEMKTLLTVQEISKVLGVSEYTVYKLISSKEIESFKIRNRIKIKADDLIKYISGR